MILYHGSNVKVEAPRIIITNRTLDFGAGFYATSSEQQATRWAKTQTLRRGNGTPTVSVYEFDKEKAEKVSILHFKENRKSVYCGKNMIL